MERMLVKSGAFGCIIGLVVACNAKREAAPTTVIDKEKIKNEIQRKEDAFANLYNSGELKNIGYYAEDATSFFQNTAPLVGREAILTFLRSDITSNTDRISFKTNEIFVSTDGDQVVEIGSFKVVDSDTLLDSGNYMSLFEKRNGNYVVVRDMSASEMPTK
jgi:ketosteroid isomerase-like protein